jgi:hypothetical protein
VLVSGFFVVVVIGVVLFRDPIACILVDQWIWGQAAWRIFMWKPSIFER